MRRFLSTAAFFLIGLATFAQPIATVTTTADSGPGSLRQAILDVNANAAFTGIHFNIPTTDGNYNAALDVATIKLISSLPKINRRGLAIDGSTQPANAPAVILGSNQALGFPSAGNSVQITRPRISIVDEHDSLITGLYVNARAVKISGLHMSGFGKIFDNFHHSIYVHHGADSCEIFENFIGGGLSSNGGNIVAPAANYISEGGGLFGIGNKYGVLRNNIFAHNGAMGAYFAFECRNWEIHDNEFYHNGTIRSITDGLDVAFRTRDFVVERNLSHFNGGNGFDLNSCLGGHIYRYNTSHHNGQLKNETNGFRIWGENNTFEFNNVYDNYGNGFHLTAQSNPAPTRNNIIRKNRIINNGNIVGNLPNSPKTNAIGIDVVATGGNNLRGVTPYVTLNSDVPAGNNGGNNLNNFPVIESAEFDGTNLRLKGFVRAGQTVDVYTTDYYAGALAAQGVEHKLEFVEGSPADADATTGNYSGVVNGKNVGSGTNVNRFDVTLASTAFAVGDSMTTTATGADGTSEFSPAIVVTAPAGPVPTITPFANCKFNITPTQLAASFGYTSTFLSTQNFTPPTDNFYNGTPSSPFITSFSTGTTTEAMDLVFTAGGSALWSVLGNIAIADASTAYCPADLAVSVSVDSATANQGSTVNYIITITNNSGASGITKPAFLTNVQLSFNVPDSLNILSMYLNGPGTWDSTLGVINVDYINPGSSFTFHIIGQVQGNSSLTSSLVSLDQGDIISTNNTSTASINKNASGGNAGGIESQGGLSQLLGQRNMQRTREGRQNFYNNISALPVAENHVPMTRKSGASQVGLFDLTPLNGPEGSTGRVVTPQDLIGITNAVEVFSVDYFKSNERRLGSILGLESPQGVVYDHTKVVCDRLTGAHMPEILNVNAANHPFLMAKLIQENGEVDYNITFVVYVKADGSFEVDNKWNLTEYSPKAGDRVLNFQVWTVSPHLTIALVEEMIQLMESHGDVKFLNKRLAARPTVFVEKGYYKNGKLHLTLNNSVAADRITIYGSSTFAETANRDLLFKDFELPANTAQVNIELPTGYVFDAGFSITNNTSSGADQIYVADGAWGMDYEFTSASNTKFNTFSQDTELSGQGVEFERSAEATARVIEYFSLYRVFRPGAYREMDLSAHETVSFKAKASKKMIVNVTLVKKGIDKWQDQFRLPLEISTEEKEYTLNLADFVSATGNAFTAEDLMSIVWTVTATHAGNEVVSVTASDLRFGNKGQGGINVEAKANEVKIYPNPSKGQFTTVFAMEFEANVTIELLNNMGQVVSVLHKGSLAEGQHSLSFEQGNRLRAGIYYIRVSYARESKSGILVITP